MIAGGSHVHASSGRGAAAGGVPGKVDVVAERTTRVGIGGDHRLVIEVVSAAVKSEEIYARVSLAAVGGFSYGQLRAIDSAFPLAGAEEHHDVAVESVALG